MPRIHYTKPCITEREVAYATDAARNGWGDRCYEYINRFEEAFKTHLGAEYSYNVWRGLRIQFRYK